MSRELFIYVKICLSVGFALFLLSSKSLAQIDYSIDKLGIEARTDFEQLFHEDKSVEGGFTGKYINLDFNAHISDEFSFNYKQRFNIPDVSFSSFFQGIDWLYLTYKANENFSVSAGKQVVNIGGFEYDAAPIDVYEASNFWNNIVCYEMGVEVSYTDIAKRNNIKFQIVNSPFVTGKSENIYAYNLIWYGTNSPYFSTIYSVNLLEYSRSKYVGYIALGNKFEFDNLSFYLDFTDRFNSMDNVAFKDYSLVGKVNYKASEQWSLFALGGYDTNDAQLPSTPSEEIFDRVVAPGVSFTFGGIGGEFFPLKDESVRIHALCSYRDYSGNSSYKFNIGATWHFDVLKSLKETFE